MQNNCFFSECQVVRHLGGLEFILYQFGGSCQIAIIPWNTWGTSLFYSRVYLYSYTLYHSSVAHNGRLGG